VQKFCPKKLGIYNVVPPCYNRYYNPEKEEKMTDYPDRYSQRIKGTICHVLDVEKATAFLKEKLDAPDVDFSAEVMAIVNGKNGVATVISEGVGWYADKEGKLPINYWGKNGMSGYVDITPEELAPLISDETTDLVDFVRIFGDRLETNLWLWQSYAKGYPQDKMSVVAGIMVA
jgi:hypothetical protein